MSERFARWIRVLPNPWASLDHLGRPVCAVPWDTDHNPNRGWVGARIDPERTQVLLRRQPGDLRSDVQDTLFAFDTKPAEVPPTKHYLQCIRDGSLLAADPLAAKLAGIKFVEPAALFAETREKAIRKFDSDYGAGSWECLADRRGELPQGASLPSEVAA